MEKYYDWDQQLTSPLWTAPGGQDAARGAEPTQETNWIRRTWNMKQFWHLQHKSYKLIRFD